MRPINDDLDVLPTLKEGPHLEILKKYQGDQKVPLNNEKHTNGPNAKYIIITQHTTLRWPPLFTSCPSILP